MIAKIQAVDLIDRQLKAQRLVLRAIANHKDIEICPLCGKKLKKDGAINFYYCPTGHDLSASRVFSYFLIISGIKARYFCVAAPYFKLKASSLTLDSRCICLAPLE